MFRKKTAAFAAKTKTRSIDKHPKAKLQWLKYFKSGVLTFGLAFSLATASCVSSQEKQKVNTPAPVQTAQMEKPDKRYRARHEIRIVSGLENNVRYWSEIYTNPFYRAIIAENHSRENLQIRDYSDKWPKKPPRTQRANIKKFILEPLVKSLNKIRRCLGKEKTECTKRKLLLFKLGMREQMEEGASRYTQWQQHVENIFADKGLPPYLAALMIVESQCDPWAKSSSGALGPYQLMPWTIKRFRLYSDGRSVDERRNWIFAAIAAAEYLENDSKILKRLYGDIAYLLSTSAFHAGLPNLLAALRNSEKVLQGELKKKPTSAQIFAHAIYSPQFTRRFASDSKDYPPQLYAAIRLLNNLPKKKIMPTREFELISLVKPQEIKLSSIVDMLDISKEVFLELNRQYNPKMYEKIILSGDYSNVRFLVPKGGFERVMEHSKGLDLGKISAKRFYASRLPSQKVVAACKNDSYCRTKK